MPASPRLLKILALLSVVFLTACGEESDSGSESSSDSGGSDKPSSTSLAGTTSFSDSLVLGKRFFIATPESGTVTKISTVLFSDESASSKTVDWGQGYIESTDSGYIDSSDSSDKATFFLEQSTWSVGNDGKLILTDGDNGTALIKSSHEDYLTVCFYEASNSSDCDGDENNERWYQDKAKAKAYVVSSTATGGTSVNLNVISDPVLNAHFTALEFDYTEQVEEIYRPNASIKTKSGVQEQGIKSVAGLEQFTELKKLTLYENQITDISNLSALTNLEWLLISDQLDSSGDDVNLKNYNAIYSMVKLIKLELSEYDSANRPVKFDLAKFINETSADKTKLEFLFFWGLPLTNTDVAAVNGLASLRKLSISEGVVTDFDQWNTIWGNVTELRVSGNGNGNLAKLSLDELVSGGLVWSSLEKLELSKTDIDNADLNTILAGVGGTNSSLRFLDIQNTNITSYAAFDNYTLPKLERLKLKYGNGASNRATYDLSSSPFTNSNMTRLELENGNISKFDVSSFSSLERLDISGSDITDTTVSDFKEALAGLSKLSRVDIADAKIAGNAFTCSDIGIGSSTSSKCTK